MVCEDTDHSKYFNQNSATPLFAVKKLIFRVNSSIEIVHRQPEDNPNTCYVKD